MVHVDYKQLDVMGLALVPKHEWEDRSSLLVSAIDTRYGYPSVPVYERIYNYDDRWGKTFYIWIYGEYKPPSQWIERPNFGLTLSIPGEEEKDLLKPTASGVGAGASYITTDYWKTSCIAKDGVSGAGFLVTSPEGVKFTFDKSYIAETSYREYWMWNPRLPVEKAENLRRLRHYYPSKVEDIHHNILTFEYVADANGALHVSRISSNDGRRVDFRYRAPAMVGTSKNAVLLLDEIEANGQVWKYSYGASSELQRVERPDGGTWEYTYEGPVYNENLQVGVKTVKYPSGGLVTYAYQTKPANYFGGTSKANDIHVISTRDISGPNVTAGRTLYSFDMTPSGRNRTRVASAAGLNEYEFSHANDWQLGSLIVSRTFDSAQDLSQSSNISAIDTSSLSLLQETSYTWASLPQIGDNGVKDRPIAKTIPRVIASSTTTRDGTSYTTNYSNFDGYGHPQHVVEQGQESRVRDLSWWTNPTNWILHREKNESIAGEGDITREYDAATGDLIDEYHFGVHSHYDYYPTGDLKSKTDARGNSTHYYDYVRGVPQREVNALGVAIERSVNPTGTVSWEKDGRGNTTRYMYDDLNRVRLIQYPIHDEVTSLWPTQNVQTIVRGKSSKTIEYDGFMRQIAISEADVSNPSTPLRATTKGYDSVGRLIYQSYPQPSPGGGITYEYDALDRVTKVSPGDGNDTTVEYKLGNVASVTNARQFVTTYKFRSFGDPGKRELIRVEAPEQSVVDIDRNLIGQIRAVTRGGVQRAYEYTPEHFLWKVTEPETGLTEFGRDEVGNMISRQVGSSAVTLFTYDELNRLKSVDYPGDTPDVVRDYDENGNIKYVDTGLTRWDYVYDARNNRTAEILTVGENRFAVRYDYDGEDFLSLTKYPSGSTIRYQPDALGRPTKVSPYLSNVEYYGDGHPKRLVYANGSVVNTALTPLLRVGGISDDTGNIINLDYDYDPAGNVAAITNGIDSNATVAIGYDGLDRIASATGSWGAGNVTYYPNSDNIRSKSTGGGLSYSYEAGTNRLGSITGARSYSFLYDAYGNVTDNGTTTFVYDDAGNLRSSSGFGATNYVYDGNNRLVKKEWFGDTSYEINTTDGRRLLEYAPTRDQYVEYAYLGSQPIAARKITSVSTMDSDGDGYSDAYELSHGLDPIGLDADGDGLSDAEEVALGTDPLIVDTDGDGISDKYEVLVGMNPLNGSDGASDNDGDGLSNIEEYLLGTNASSIDTDGDGLNDALEVTLRTNPLNADTDADGMSDKFEYVYHLDPLDASDAGSDLDYDGLNNVDEYRNGTNPLVLDTDLDGLADGDEVALGTDSANQDTDGDGMLDGEDDNPMLNIAALMVIIDQLLLY